jgi:hypothetical protein
MTLSKQVIDARVQAAIENLQAGRGVEDDAGIEFKGDWPEPASKARQLAGAANALRGEPLIYVIGVHDQTGAVTVPAKTEPQEWYAKVSKPFDQIAPELLWTQTVFVGDDKPQSVTVLVFATDEFPYVINGQNRREVPLRVATGTESARRNQLVRMFEPSLRAPALTISEAAVTARWTDSPNAVLGAEPLEIERRLWLLLSVECRVFVEHTGPVPLTLPVRDMRARLICTDFETRPDVKVRHLGDTGRWTMLKPGQPAPPEPVPPQYGVYARDQHVVATAPGEFTIMADTRWEGVAPNDSMSDSFDLFGAEDEMRLDLVLRVVGVERPIHVSAKVVRTNARTESSHASPHGDVSVVELGRWELRLPDSDPWG